MKNKKYHSILRTGMLVVLMLIFRPDCFGQISSYTFSSSTQNYQELVIGNVLGDTTTQDQYFINQSLTLGDTVQTGPGIPIGFIFDYNGFGMDVFGLSANGWIALGSGGVNMNSSSLFFPLSSTTGGNFIAACARNLQAQNGSSLRYITSGTAPSRTLTIEWKNYRKHSNFGDSFNFQIQLHESNNSIEFHYGPFTHNINASFATVGLTGISSADFSVRSTTGTGGWGNTSTGSLNSATCTLNPSTLPQNGLVFRWTEPQPCSSPPIAGTTNSSAMTVCPNTPFLLSLTGNSTGPGQSYQWKSSSASIVWLPISGAVATSVSTTQSANTWYRCEVTCSGQSAYSNAIKVQYNPPNLCYCTQNLGGQCASFGYIDSVNIALTTLQNYSTGCAALTDIYYSDYPVDSNTTATLIAGTSYSISVTCSFNASISLWIDYNQSGSFDANEWTQVSSSTTANVASTIIFSVPSTALSGFTKMRLRCRSSGSTNGAIDACTNFLSGETEDYTLTIISTVDREKQLTKNPGMIIYPNPGDEKLRIKLSENAEDAVISILNLEGKTLMIKKISNSNQIEFDLGDLNPGIYIVRLQIRK